MKKFIIVFVVSLLLPLAAQAQVPADGQSGGGASSGKAPVNTVGQSPADTLSRPPADNIKRPPADRVSNPTQGIAVLPNPLKAESLVDLFKNIIDIILGIGYVVVGFFLLLSGFKFVTAQGSEDKIKEAKQTFYYTIIGAVIIIGAQTIASILQKVMTGLTK